jgi:uncharacterized membrane protein
MHSESIGKSAVRWVLACAMVAIGALHFVSPTPFAKIVPAWLPAPYLLVYVSGFFEILGGVGLVIPRVQVAAAWGLVALYVAVFPANVNMAVHRIAPTGRPLPDAALWGRLPFQLVLIGLAVWLARPTKTARREADARPD